MESPMWVNKQEKWAYILLLRDHEVYLLKVTGSKFSLKKNLQKVLEALEGGQVPSEVKAKSVEMLDARAIGKAELGEGNKSLSLYGEGENPKKLKFSPPEYNADTIWQAVQERSGKTFQSTKEDIGAVEAVVPLAIWGGLGGLLWYGLYDAATKLAAGETLKVSGRRQGLQRMLNGVAGMLGTTGTVALGVVLLALVLGWAVRRVVRRPQRTMLVPEKV